MIHPTLSLWQPWASFLAWGVKGPETRSWPCPPKYIGKPMLIHAAKRPANYNEGMYEHVNVFHEGLLAAKKEWRDLEYGAILGVGTVTACYRTEDVFTANIDELEEARAALLPVGCYPITPLQWYLGDYSEKRFAWVFEDLRAFETPIPYRGMQGIFSAEIPDELAQRLGLMPCRKCGGQMKPGQALQDIATGTPDFPGSEIMTLSPGGSAKLIDCFKCSACGWSVTK